MFNNAFRGKRVLVTGHTGFKGSWLCQWLLELGAEVAGMSIDVPTSPSHFDVLDLKSRIKHYVGDIRGIGKTQGILGDFNPEIVFHLAAQSLVRPSYDDPKSTFDTNVGGTVNVLEAVRQTPSVRGVLIVTSDKCYENRETGIAYKETDRLGGDDPYSASKACAEIVFSSYFKSFYSRPGLAAIASARAGNVVGGGDWASDRLIPDCVKAWSKKETVEIRNPKSTRPWQHVLEPLSGYLWLTTKLLENPSRFNGESFNFGPKAESNQNVESLVSEIKKHWPSASWKIREDVQGKKEAKLLMLDCEKAHSELNWKPVWNFEKTIEMTAEWYQKFAAEKTSVTSRQITQYCADAKSAELIWTR